MKAYLKERLENALCYFAREHQRHARGLPFQTHIYKYLAFFDLQLLEETGSAPLDLEYLAMDQGPVPIVLYRNRRSIQSKLFRFIELPENKFKVQSLAAPDLDYFSGREKQKMDELIYIFAKPGVKTGMMSKASHEALGAWKRAHARGANAPILHADSFPNVAAKDESDLSAAEEHFIVSEALRQAGP